VTSREADTARDPSMGHRLVPHVADVILEAWAPTRARCLEEAVLGLVGSFVDTGSDGSAGTDATDATEVHTFAIGGGPDERVLVDLLEEVLFLLDARGVVPVGVHVDERADGGLSGSFACVPADGRELTGAVPKGVSRSDLVFERRDAGWWCRVIVDV